MTMSDREAIEVLKELAAETQKLLGRQCDIEKKQQKKDIQKGPIQSVFMSTSRKVRAVVKRARRALRSRY